MSQRLSKNPPKCAKKRIYLATLPHQTSSSGRAPWPALCNILMQLPWSVDHFLRVQNLSFTTGDTTYSIQKRGEWPCNDYPTAGRRPWVYLENLHPTTLPHGKNWNWGPRGIVQRPATICLELVRTYHAAHIQRTIPPPAGFSALLSLITRTKT